MERGATIFHQGQPRGNEEEETPMELRKIVEAVDAAYDRHDGMLARVFDEYEEHLGSQPGVARFQSMAGDTLAEFVVIELHETHDPGATDAEQIVEASRVMGAAADQLRRVAEALEDLR